MSRASVLPAKAQSVAPLFAALGDETRLQVLLRLSRRGRGSIAEVGEGVSVSRQAVTKHLNVLAKAGFVQGERHGREHVWRLRPERLKEVQAWLDRVSREWDGSLQQLQRFVEDGR